MKKKEKQVQKEKEIWERRGDDLGPKPNVTAQSLHPESIMKMTPHPAERSKSTASHIVRGYKKGEKVEIIHLLSLGKGYE